MFDQSMRRYLYLAVAAVLRGQAIPAHADVTTDGRDNNRP
jgi:hypothetical protein